MLPTMRWSMLFLSAGLTAGGVAQELRFQHLTADDGLIDNAITCLMEDRAGYLWIGTENGLDKYDGSSVQHIEGIGASIASVIEDRAGIIWVATKDQGLLRIDPSSGERKAFTQTEGSQGAPASDKLTALHDLDDTTLLIGSREVTLMFLDKRTFHFTYAPQPISLVPRDARESPSDVAGWCHAIVPLDEDLLWVGLLNMHTSLIVDRRSGKVLTELLLMRDGSETQTCALLHDGRFYTGGWQNGIDVFPWREDVALLRKAALSPTQIMIPEEVTALVPWKSGLILAGTRQLGLYLLDPTSGHMERSVRVRADASSLSSDRVRCMLVDSRSTLWVGTANGLNYHARGVWPMRTQNIYGDALADHPDVTFHHIESLGEGVRLFTSEGFFTQDHPGAPLKREALTYNGRELQPTAVGRDLTGRELIGTEYGLTRRDDGGGFVPAIEPANTIDQFSRLGAMYQVRGIATDTVRGAAVLVMATLGYGVQVVDPQAGRILGSAMPGDAMAVNTRSLVQDMVRDAGGTYWFASSGGLFSWRRDRPMTAPSARITGPTNGRAIIEPGEEVRAIILRNDEPWAVTRSGMLLHIVDGKAMRHVPPDEQRSTMHGLAADRQGRLWITTDDGLLRFDGASNGFVRFPVNDGRAFRKLTRAITALPDGRIAFCADNTLITFDPNDLDHIPSLPAAFITSVSAAGNALAVNHGTVSLSYRSSVLDLGISAQAFRFPQPLTFEYRLDDVESEWRSVTARGIIRYAAIPVGTHRLRVHVRDPYGRMAPEQVLLTVSVVGPIWQQWWFYALALAGTALVLYILYRYRLSQALHLQAVRDRIASDLHDEVGSSLSSITIGTQLAAQLSHGENEQVKQLMARIGETSSQSLRSMSDIVWAIDPKNDEGEALVKRMRRIAQELLESKGIEVSFSVSGGVEDLKLPMNARKEIVLIFKEAVHNASKYSDAGTVQVSLHRRNGTLAVSVKDDGRGFDPALHPDGHGLGSMTRRAGTLDASLHITSAPGMGTLVGLEVDLARIRD